MAVGKRKINEAIIPGDDLEWRWSEEEVKQLITLYCDGKSLGFMANDLDRRVTEIIVMLDDLITKEKIPTNRTLMLL